MNLTLVVLAAVGGAVVLLALAGLRVVKEYQRAVVFRLGRYSHMKSPGLRLIIPLIDRLVRVDLRAVHVEVPPQDVITQDNVLVTVRAVMYFQVVNPPLAVTKVVDYASAARDLAQSSLRSTLGQVSLADLLGDRDKINRLLERVLDEQLEPWGIQVTAIEIKDVLLPDAILRALSREAETEQETRAKVRAAEGERAALAALSDAASALAHTPSVLQLRYLQTLSEIGTDRSTVVVFPVPIDLLEPLVERRSAENAPASTAHAPVPATPPVAATEPASAATSDGPRGVPTVEDDEAALQGRRAVSERPRPSTEPAMHRHPPEPPQRARRVEADLGVEYLVPERPRQRAPEETA